MKNNKKEKITVHDIIVKRILPLLTIPFFLSGCAKRSDCELKDDHVHLYTKTAKNAIVQTYMYNEYMKTGSGFEWTDNCIKVDEDTLNFYKTKGELFEGADNWEYLYNTMASQHDYLKYYFTYDDLEWMPEVPSISKGYYYWATTSGWTEDKNHRGVTGEVKVFHSRYYGYNIVYKDGKYVKEKSPLVDDIRDIIDDYPYFASNCVVTVESQIYDFNEDQLESLTVEDVSEFRQPDLANTELHAEIK